MIGEDMSSNPKFNNSKNAAVSLDSLLGLLSSAYGTEELDSNTVFDENVINWRNISVESFKALPKKDNAGDKPKKLESKELQKYNAATSTTNLKRNISLDGEIDITLLSIKSLQNFRGVTSISKSATSLVGKCSFEVNCQPADMLEDKVLSENISCESPIKVVSENFVRECDNSCEGLDDDRPIICRYSFEDPDIKMAFEIQFVKKVHQNDMIPVFEIGDPEISINSIDNTKQTSVILEISKNCLVAKSFYFSDVDKQFGLENVDVIVMCNFSVFQWIIQWLKADSAMCKPNLNITNLKYILTFAYHLGINQLVDECLKYLHSNFNSVLESDSDIENVFDDKLISKLVSCFTNSKVDRINDKFSSFKSKLYCSLIKLMLEPRPCSNLGHYSSLSFIFQCGFCEKILHIKQMESTPCRSDSNDLNFKGEIVPYHECSTSWDLSNYIELLYDELKSWKLVYWRLWGLCHFLYCKYCHISYPVCQSEWCSYHPVEADYFPINSNVFHPIGMFECCGEKAFRFNTLQLSSGCKFRCHSPQLSSTEEIAIQQIYEINKVAIQCQPPTNVVVKKFVKLVKKSSDGEIKANESDSKNFWWEGIRLAPKEKKDYSLIPLKVLNHLRNKPQPKKLVKVHHPLTITQIPYGTMPVCKNIESTYYAPSKNCFTNALSPCHSKTKQSSTLTSIKNKSKRKKSANYQPAESFWQSTMSEKDNQDCQRDFEEIAMRNLVKMLSSVDVCGYDVERTAGSYIRLEGDWWQEHCGSGSSKSSSTVVNRTFPLSWFRKSK